MRPGAVRARASARRRSGRRRYAGSRDDCNQANEAGRHQSWEGVAKDRAQASRLGRASVAPHFLREEGHPARLLEIPTAQIATIGDMPTNVLMFSKSGFSIAMGNASDAVKAQASAVTDSNENEGFAKAVRKFVLAR